MLNIINIPEKPELPNLAKEIKFGMAQENAIYSTFGHKKSAESWRLPGCSISLQCSLGNLRTRLPNFVKSITFSKVSEKRAIYFALKSPECFLRLGLQNADMWLAFKCQCNALRNLTKEYFQN